MAFPEKAYAQRDAITSSKLLLARARYMYCPEFQGSTPGRPCVGAVVCFVFMKRCTVPLGIPLADGQAVRRSRSEGSRFSLR